MAELNNIPDTDDTKTRVTAKISDDTPGKSAPPIDLTSQTPEADSSTMTRRTMKLAGLAGLATAPKAAAAPAKAPAAAESDDTRTRRTIKLTGLSAAPAVNSLNINKPAPAAAPAPKAEIKNPNADTVTRRTQKLEALDTKDVIAMTEADIAGDDTNTRKTIKIADPVASPAPQAAAPSTPKTRQTVKVDNIAPIHTPVIDLNAKPGDTNTRKTVKVSIPAAQTPQIDLDAQAGDDTRTRQNVKVAAAPAAAAPLKAGNVDDTVKLQRPAPKPAIPGSVAPAAQAGTPAVGGIKLNKPAPKAQPKAAPAPAAAPAAAPVAAPAAAPAAAKKSTLTANTAALPTGKAPDVHGGAPPQVNAAAVVPLKNDLKPKESLGLNITFAFFGVLAFLLLAFIAAMTVSDHYNVWVKEFDAERIEMPIVSDYINQQPTEIVSEAPGKSDDKANADNAADSIENSSDSGAEE